MKILHLIDSGGLYGAEVMLLNLATEQVRQGLKPVIASIGELRVGEKPLEAEARRLGLRVEEFRMRPGPNWMGGAQVLRFARNQGVKLLHSHGYKCNILFGLLPKAIRRLPLVSTVHGWTSSERWNRMKIYEELDAFSLRFIDRVVLVNEGMRAHTRLQNSPGQKAQVVNNGLPELALEGQAHQLDPAVVRFCEGGTTFGAIGRLSPEKGFDVLLEAFALCKQKLPQARLLILGDGKERDRLEGQVKGLNLCNSVLMPGYRAQAFAYLSLLQGFVLSSHTEGLPIVLLEAMRAGVPVVGTRVGGIPAVLGEGEAGLLVAPSDSKALGEALERLVDPTAGCWRLATKAKERVRENYSSQAMARGYLKIYQSLGVCRLL